MSALIPALIKLFMSRARGGGGGGGRSGGYGGSRGGSGRAPKSPEEQDEEYWRKQNLSVSSAYDGYEAALKSMPKMMTFEEATNAFAPKK